MWNAGLVDIGHDVFEAIKLFDVPEISSRLISSIERTLFVCGGHRKIFSVGLEREVGFIEERKVGFIENTAMRHRRGG